MNGVAMQPRELGPYRFERRLGAGAMGTVYLAEGESGPVAVKVVHPHLLERQGFFKRFQREADAGSTVDHVNVVRTLDYDLLVDEGVAYCFLVMEYVEGRTLWELLGDLGTIPETLLREVALQIAHGLAAIHSAGVVHRDIKPENVLITDDHDVRIMDLGVARLLDATRGLTDEGGFAGTLLYAAPEQLTEGRAEPSADLYALGVVLYELATGMHPFRHDDAAAILHAHLHTTPRPLHEVMPELSPFLGVVVETLLAKDPAQRFASAAELAVVLADAEGSSWWSERESAAMRRRGDRPRIPVRRETDLHGRADLLEFLSSQWTTARGGDGRVVLLEGEAGIGKSRLVDAFVDSLADDDCHVLYGSYPPTGGMGGLSDALLAKFGMSDLASAVAAYVPEMSRSMPTFASHVRDESTAGDDEALSAGGLHTVFARLLRGLASEKPLVWIIEDLHFADRDSRAYVLSLARAAAGTRALVVLTSRGGTPPSELSALSRLGGFERTAVGRLSPREVMQLLRDAFRSAQLAEKLGGRIAYKSDGVPFFVFEMIRGLREGQFISRLPDGTYVETRVVDEIEVPSSVRDLIEARLQDLSEEQRAILDTGAVHGFEFDPRLLAAVLDEKPVRLLRQLAHIERRSGLVRSEGLHYRFDHHQLQELLYEALPESLRCAYHGELAAAYAARVEERGSALTGGDHAFLAEHQLRSADPVSAEPHIEGALAHLDERYANEKGAELAAVALNVEGLLTGEQRLDVLLRRASLLGRIGRRPEQREALESAVACADEFGDDRRRSQARSHLGALLQTVGEYDEAIELLEASRSMAAAAGDARQEASATGNLANVMMRVRRNDEALELMERALQLARACGFRRSEGSTHLARGIVYAATARQDEALDEYARAREIFAEVGNRIGEGYAVGNAGIVHFERGDLEAARRAFAEHLELSRRCGGRLGEGAALGNLGSVDLQAGRLADAVSNGLRCLAVCEEIQNRAFLANQHISLSETFRALGDRERAAQHAAAAHGIAEALSQPQILRRSRVEQAAARDNEALQELLPELRAQCDAEALVKVLLIAGAEAQDEDALALLEEAERTSEENELVGPTVHAAALRARRDPSLAVRAKGLLDQHAARIGALERIAIHAALWAASRDRSHRTEAKRLLGALCEAAPEEYRDAMLCDVPLYAEVDAL